MLENYKNCKIKKKKIFVLLVNLVLIYYVLIIQE